MLAFQNVIMSIKARISFSVPEILRRDGSAFADWYHHLNVPLTNILREQEEGSDSSSTEQLAWELLSLRESPSSSRGSLDSHDWLGAPLTPVSTQHRGPGGLRLSSLTSLMTRIQTRFSHPVPQDSPPVWESWRSGMLKVSRRTRRRVVMCGE